MWTKGTQKKKNVTMQRNDKKDKIMEKPRKWKEFISLGSKMCGSKNSELYI
jgi:hypothetical protein